VQLKIFFIYFIYCVITFNGFLCSPVVMAETVGEVLIRTFEGHTDSVRTVAFSPDGSKALSSSSDSNMKLWHIETGEVINTFGNHADKVYSVVFFSDGEHALSGSRDNTLKLWNVETGEKIRTLRGHTGSVRSVALSADEKLALSGSEDKTMKLWDVVQEKTIQTFEGHNKGIYAVAFSPTDDLVLSGSLDDTAKLWNMTTGEVSQTFKHRGDIKAVAFSPDGQYAVTGSEDKTIKLWEVATGQEFLTLKGHTNEVEAVTFHRHGRYLLSASEDQTIKLWDIASGENIQTLQDHTDWVYTVAFSPNGLYALSGSRDATLKLWKINASPTAQFTLSPLAGSAPLTVTLDASAATDENDEIIDYTWLSSDGRQATGEIKTLRYDTPGEYTLTLTVSDSFGATNSQQQILTVKPLEPKIQHSTTLGTLPLTVTFDASASLGEIVSYHWVIDNKKLTGASTQYTFNNGGIYPVTLTIIDPQEKTAAVTEELIVTQPPTADFTFFPQQGNQPLTVRLDASQSVDPDGKIVAWQWQSDTGKSATGQQVTMTFTEMGPQTINLTVTDNHGATATAQQTLMVTSLPVAQFQETLNLETVPMTVTLDGSQSLDPDGGELINYQWQATSDDISLSAKGKAATLTLEKPAYYSLTLTVTDDEDESASVSKTILATQSALLTFQNLQDIYTVGEQITTELVETLPHPSQELVDLWVAIQTPQKELFFLTSQPQAPFSLEPQAFKIAVSPTETNHQLLSEIEVTEAMSGEYIFYALYVANGRNPFTEGTEVFRSELAIKNITLVQ